MHVFKHLSAVPFPSFAGGTGVLTPMALLRGVSAASGLKIQFLHPVPLLQQVSYATYHPSPKQTLKFLTHRSL